MREIQFQNGEHYHIYNRGVDGRNVFVEKNDYVRFLRSMREFNTSESFGGLYLKSIKEKRGPTSKALEVEPLIKIFLLLLFAALISFRAPSSSATSNLTQKLAGRILLQVEACGEAWYVNPADLKRYYLGRPADTFALMRALGIGITNADLAKIPVGLIDDGATDGDGDGLSDSLENALGTDSTKNDSDNDGYSDKTEIENNYTPLGKGKMNINSAFASANAGKIFLQTEKNGEAWYVNPADKKRYFLGRPTDAFALMKNLGLGITNNDLGEIIVGDYPTGDKNEQAQNNNNGDTTSAGADVIAKAADAFRAGDKEKVVSYFIPEMQRALEYTMDSLNSDSKLMLGNILSGAVLTSSTAEEKIYKNNVYFSLGGYDVTVKFYVKKQAGDKWLLANL